MTTFTAAAIARRFTGSFTAMITPFSNDHVDEIALRAMVEFQIAGGTAGLVPCGTTGETATMTTSEQDQVISAVVAQANGRVPVIAGTGTNGTRTTIERTQRAQALGVDGALVVTPYYNKPTQDGLYQHFATVATHTDLPVVLYNVPGRTGVNLLPETVIRLAAIPNIVGIKEASGSLDQVTEIRRETSAEFVILAGDDSLTLPIMSVGGDGVISVVSNVVPAAMARLTAACLAGDFAAARELHLSLFELCRAMFCETNPVPVKTAASLLGLCRAEVRSPLVPLSEASRRRVHTAVANCPFVMAPALAA